MILKCPIVFICLYTILLICQMKGISSYLRPHSRRWLSSSKKGIKSTIGDDFEYPVKMDKLVAMCKSRGYIFPSSEIYGGLSGFYDFGPLGVELKNNIKKLWWRDMVQRRDDIVGLDSSIIASSAVWKASGHLDGFSDPMVDCKKTNARYRADQVYWAALYAASGDSTAPITYVTVLESENMQAEAKADAEKRAKALGIKGPFKPLELLDLTTAPVDIFDQLPSPATGIAGDLTQPRDFNLMFKTNVGAVADEASSTAYLRPETAQGIFTNYPQILRTSRKKIPFGIAQVGKAFRNEITPRNFIFRSREFEQMEIEYFIEPTDNWVQQHEEWIDVCYNWLLSLGLKSEHLIKSKHPPNKLAHYALACTDFNFSFSFGNQELMGIAARGSYDLTQHAQHSGKPMEYFDEATQVKFLPHVIEPSIGVERLMLALLTSAYREEMVAGEKRTVLGLHPALAPIKASVLPLLSNKSELITLAKSIYKKLQLKFNVDYDSSGAIGRRYRRADECGTPYCITVDFESLSDNSVTVRDRDSMSQQRVSVDALTQYLAEKIDG